MKNMLKKWSITGLLLIFIITAITGCSGETKTEGSSDEPSEDVKEQVYPVSIDGTEIIIGETTVQTLLDKGFRMTVSEMTPDYEYYEYEIDPEAELEANSYYTGGSIWITDSVFANISIVTDEEAIRMGDAVIAYLEFSLTGAEEDELKRISFNGVPVSELDRDKAGEVFPDFTGDDTMWFSSSSTVKDYKYYMGFSSQDGGKLTKFSVEKKYDVDWNSGE